MFIVRECGAIRFEQDYIGLGKTDVLRIIQDAREEAALKKSPCVLCDKVMTQARGEEFGDDICILVNPYQLYWLIQEAQTEMDIAADELADHFWRHQIRIRTNCGIIINTLGFD